MEIRVMLTSGLGDKLRSQPGRDFLGWARTLLC